MLKFTRAQDCSIYIASPLGFSEAGREFYYEKLLPIVRGEGFQIIDPWQLTPEEKVGDVVSLPYGQQRKDAWEKLNMEIGHNNRKGIERANGLVAVLDGSDVDSGTASEIGFAFGLGKVILGYRGDFRLAGDNDGSLVNLQVEYFIKASGGRIISKFQDLGPELRRTFLK